MLTSCGPLQSFLSMTVCKNRTSNRTSTVDIVGGQAATDGVGTDGSLLSSNRMTTRISCCGESVLQMLAQNKAILSWCVDSGTATARAIVGAVGGVISMFQTPDDVNVICICNDLRTLSCSERDVAQSIACPPLKRSVVGSILLSGPSCSLGYFPFQPVVHNWFIKGRGMYCSVYGKVHIKDPLLLIEKSSLCGGSGFPSKKCVNVTI